MILTRCHGFVSTGRQTSVGWHPKLRFDPGLWPIHKRGECFAPDAEAGVSLLLGIRFCRRALDTANVHDGKPVPDLAALSGGS